MSPTFMPTPDARRAARAGSHWRLRVAAVLAVLAAAAQGTDTVPRVAFTGDPMRPTVPALAPAGAPPSAASPADAAGSADARGLPRLEATHRNVAGRRAALLDGRWRSVGDAVGDLRVAAIGDVDVVLTRGDERITLSLLTVRTRPSAAPRDAPPRNPRGAAE